MSALRSVRISGTGSFLPEKVLTNHDLEKMVDTSDEWITTRTGIKERHIAADDVATSDLAAEASRRALEDAGLTPEDIDLIIVATITPDTPLPSCACWLQAKIGALNAGALDVSAACSGFVYGANIAWQFVRTGVYDNVLVIGAETLSKFTNWEDRTSCILFGDGAGAAVFSPSDDAASEILYGTMGADGRGAEIMITPAGGSRKPASQETVDNKEHCMVVRGRETYKFAVQKMADLVADGLEKVGLTSDQLRWIIPHQVNIRILEAAVKRLGIPLDDIYINIDRVGNTSAASVPIALDEASRKGLLKRGDNIALVAFGGGLSWASMMLRW
ncbi:MAG: ketoacyl-ACP synthase III [Planctomycetes bacterium]|nr:ketoacyl-ACP synthase III [Planctomycetota bacterium]